MPIDRQDSFTNSIRWAQHDDVVCCRLGYFWLLSYYSPECEREAASTFSVNGPDLKNRKWLTNGVF